MNNDSNQNTNNPTDDQQSDRFETDSNWTDVQSQRSDDDIILLDDEEINRIEDEIFDEDEEGKQDNETDASEEVRSQPTDVPKRKFSYHKDSIYSIALNSANKSIFATGGGDDIAVVWTFDNVENPVLNTLIGHADTVDKLDYSFDGKYLATAALDGEIVVWDAATGTKKCNLDGPTQEISFIEWHSKGTAIVAGSSDKSIWVWNGNNGTFVNVFQGHLGAVTCGGFTPDGKSIISGSEDATVKVWNPKTAQCTHTISGHGYHDGPIYCMAFSPKGSLVATGSADNTACVANWQTGKAIARTPEHGSSVESIVFPENYDLFGTACLDFHVRLYDTNKFMLREKWDMGSGLNRVSHYEDKNLFVASAIDGKMYLFDHRVSSPVAMIHCHSSCIQDFKILDTNEILSADDDGKIFLYDVRMQTSQDGLDISKKEPLLVEPPSKDQELLSRTIQEAGTQEEAQNSTTDPKTKQGAPQEEAKSQQEEQKTDEAAKEIETKQGEQESQTETKEPEAK